MKFLLIDSVSSELYVALCDVVDGGTVSERVFPEQRAHDRNLNRLTSDWVEQVDAFAIVQRAGSWTGNRIGVVAVKAYAIVTEKPIMSLTKRCIEQARRKFRAKEFFTAREIEPYYDAEFKVTACKPKT